jgi:hypothetical protein
MNHGARLHLVADGEGRLLVRVQIAAVSPKALSFISASACSSELTRMMPATGPKISSRITGIE